jgi:hypothetical protein
MELRFHLHSQSIKPILKTTNALKAISFASSLFFFTAASAQGLAMHKVNVTGTEPDVTNAKHITSDDLPSETENNNSKAYRNFDRQFRTATEVKKTAIASGTIIYCKIDNVPNEFYYDKKGNLSHSVRYFNESKLNATVRDMVMEKYNGYDIFGVIEVTVADRKVYHVKLQSRSTWKTVRVTEDSMKETESFKI